MYKKKIGKCKYHGPPSWWEFFVTVAIVFRWKDCEKTDMTVRSKLLSGTFSGILLKTTSLPLLYWAKLLWVDSSMATLFSSFSHFNFSLAFSSCRFLITVPFRLMISSFRPVMLWTMDYSNLSNKPSLISRLFFMFLVL